MVSKLIVVVLSMFSIGSMFLPGLSTIQHAQAQGMQIFVAPLVDDILDDVRINDEENEDEEDESEDNRIICIEVEPGLIECFEI